MRDGAERLRLFRETATAFRAALEVPMPAKAAWRSTFARVFLVDALSALAVDSEGEEAERYTAEAKEIQRELSTKR